MKEKDEILLEQIKQAHINTGESRIYPSNISELSNFRYSTLLAHLRYISELASEGRVEIGDMLEWLKGSCPVTEVIESNSFVSRPNLKISQSPGSVPKITKSNTVMQSKACNYEGRSFLLGLGSSWYPAL